MDEKEYEIFRTKLHDLIEILRVSNVSVFEGEGYEADDYIACISRMLKLQYKITIVSSDRDMCLLINENVRVYDPIKAITITENNFQEIIGIPLKHFLTYKCMIGDTSDNIAGIEGVGEVTAKKMIEEYGRFQNIIEGLKKKDKLFVKEQKILDSIDVFERNKKLIAFDRLYDDAELRQHIKNKVKLLKIDKEKICGLLMRNNCSDLLKKVCEICLEKS
jgi:DNA polymerase-1